MGTWFASPYYRFLYAHRGDAEAEQFVEVLLNRISLPMGAHVLDAGCGEGRYTRALLRRGFQVDAIDAAVSNPNLPEGTNFFFGDLRSWHPPHKYHLIGSFFTSLGLYAQRWDEAKREVALLASWLEPMGWLVIDYLNIQKANPHPYEEIPYNDSIIVVERTQDSFALHKKVTVRHSDGSQEVFHERVLKLTEGDLSQMIERAGLQLQETWGGYTGVPFSAADSPRLILLAQKPAS
ncbi:MAG: methyltransferase domain-containing protein [Bacteroidia bacterium]|nr:methyltransferase domain-containing protein [Bacteroidia bacterium]MDW8235478.1 methyltransferase domain-containing protein [Bacteroidia bacterium]